jgi:hypothetical protein
VYAVGAVAYINYSPDALNNLSFRPGVIIRSAQPTHRHGWQHWLSPRIEFRPEIGYYHSNGANAFNGVTRNYTVIGASDVIFHFYEGVRRDFVSGLAAQATRKRGYETAITMTFIPERNLTPYCQILRFICGDRHVGCLPWHSHRPGPDLGAECILYSQLNQLSGRWDAIAFVDPVKPGQSVVFGRAGRRATV